MDLNELYKEIEKAEVDLNAKRLKYIKEALVEKWKKIINERGDKPNTYHNCLISYISEQIALSGFNMKSIGNLLIKVIVF